MESIDQIMQELEDEGEIQMRRTRDFRIDEYKHIAHIDITRPERIKRVEQHRKRVNGAA
jgi:hypothetical protein